VNSTRYAVPLISLQLPVSMIYLEDI